MKLSGTYQTTDVCKSSKSICGGHAQSNGSTRTTQSRPVAHVAVSDLQRHRDYAVSNAAQSGSQPVRAVRRSLLVSTLAWAPISIALSTASWSAAASEASGTNQTETRSIAAVETVAGSDAAAAATDLQQANAALAAPDGGNSEATEPDGDDIVEDDSSSSSSSSSSSDDDEVEQVQDSNQQQQQQQQPEEPAASSSKSSSSGGNASSSSSSTGKQGGKGTVSANLSVTSYLQILKDARRASWPLIAQKISAGDWIELSQVLVQPPFDEVRQACFYIPWALLQSDDFTAAVAARKQYVDFIDHVHALATIALTAADGKQGAGLQVQQSFNLLNASLDAFLAAIPPKYNRAAV